MKECYILSKINLPPVREHNVRDIYQLCGSWNGRGMVYSSVMVSALVDHLLQRYSANGKNQFVFKVSLFLGSIYLKCQECYIPAEQCSGGVFAHVYEDTLLRVGMGKELLNPSYIYLRNLI